MNKVRRLLAVASRKLNASLVLRKASVVGFILACIALCLMIADRLAEAAFLPWQWVVPALLIVGVVATFVLWRRSRPSEMHVALLVDERLGLREKLSTALQVACEDDAFARAAVEDAVAVAENARNHERARRAFAVAAPPHWWAAPSIVGMVVLISFMQPMNLFAQEEPEQPDVVQAKHEVRDSLDSVVQEIEQQPQLRSELADMLDDLAEPGAELDALQSPEQVRRDAIKRVTELNDRLDQIISGEKGKTMDAIEQSMKKLRTPTDGPAKELAEAMAAGNFQEAREAMEQLVEDIEAGKLTPEQQEKLAEQLKDIAQQLQQMAEDQKQLEDALEKAGMNPQLAQNPEALQQAIEQNENLNEQQKQQLQQMAQAQQASNQMCQSMGNAASDLANALAQGQMGEGSQAMGEQLSNLEQAQMLLQQAQAASAMCQGSNNGLGRGLGLQSAMQQWGQGMGTGGGGGPRQTAPSPTRTRQVKADSKTGEGDIIARMLVEGPQTVGESRIVPTSAVAEVVEGFEEGLDEDQLPRKYHEAQKRYFGELERRVREQAEETPPEQEQD